MTDREIEDTQNTIDATITEQALLAYEDGRLDPMALAAVEESVRRYYAFIADQLQLERTILGPPSREGRVFYRASAGLIEAYERQIERIDAMLAE